MPHVSPGRASTPYGISVDSGMFMAHGGKKVLKIGHTKVQT